MSTSINFVFSQGQFNRLFPFYILINGQMEVECNGISLEKLFPGTSKKPFSVNYSIKSHEIITPCFQSLKEYTDHLIFIECKNEQQTNLRGQLEYLPETNQLLFLGTPWFDSLDDIEKNKLSLSDFSNSNGIRDTLHFMKAQEIANKNLQNLQQKVRIQKNELKDANKTINDLALFTTQDPDPIIRINYEGDILQTNPAAAKLDFYEFENETYSKATFFKLIAVKIDKSANKWVFEAKSENRIYSFICITIAEGTYINIYGRDITQARNDQVQLNFLSLIIQQTQQGVVITDADAKIQWVNKAFEKSSGYTIDDVEGKTPGHILQGIDTDPVTVKYMRRQINKQRPFSCEIYNYKKSGEGYWKRLSAHPVFDSDKNLVQYFGIEEDITSEKRAQEKIKEAANRMSSLISNLHAGIILVNDKQVVELVNQRYCDLFYLQSNPSDLIGGNVLNRIFKNKVYFKDPELFEKKTRQLLNKKELAIGEILEMADGKTLQRDFIPIWNENKYNGHLVVYNDITDKVNADKKLEEQRIFYEEILDNIPADIGVYDNLLRYQYVNTTAVKDKSIRKWIVGKNDDEYVAYRNRPSEIAEGRKKILNELIETKQLKSWEEELKQSDGTSKYLLRNLAPVFDTNGMVKMVIGYAVDITQTKLILKQIEESERRYRDVIDNSLAIVTTHDMKGQFLTVNPMVHKTYGYKDDEMIGHCIKDFMPEEDKHYFEEAYLEIIGKEKTFSGTFKVVHKNGQVVYTLCNNYLKEEPGKEPYVIGFAMDITDRVTAEKELKIAKKITEELAQTKQHFLANMSHEIRTPMNAIMGMTNQLSKTALTTDQQFYLNIIHSASDNLLVIINDILDLSKIESGKLTIENIGFEPKNIIANVMQVMMLKAEEKGIYFINSFCDSRLNEVLIGDPFRLNQILLNLISNAIKFTDKGGVDISCSVIDDNESTQTVRVTVKDTGIGMDESFAKNIFKKYSQESQSTTRLFGGTGLGMSICEELIRLMGGTIQVESEKGIGTTVSFTVSFNKGVKEQVLEKEINGIDTGIIKDKKILITDDNEMNRLVATAILEEYGAIIEEAQNGQEALDKIKNNNFDIVLMDVQMPVMDGLEAVKQIRDTISKTLPVIALTAYAIKGDNEKFIQAGMDDYLSKPFQENQLLSVICNCLEKITGTEQDPVLILDTELYNLTKLQDIAKGNKQFVNKMIRLFVEQAPLTVEELHLAYKQNDFERLRFVVQRLKPNIENLNIGSLKHQVQKIELFAQDKTHSNELAGIIRNVDTVIKKVIKSLEENLL